MVDNGPSATRRRPDPVRLARTRITRGLRLPQSHRVHIRPNPATPDPVPEIGLCAIIGTWNEADVVASTVANAFRQGCQAVYLVDNASDDGTVERAVAAGAELADSYERLQYNEHERIYRMNTVVNDKTLTHGTRHVWWLFLDADEFPHGPGGLTIAAYLAGLDRRFRAVGTTTYNHYPTEPFAEIDGRHPVDLMPRCEPHVEPYCWQGHHKHPLLRQDWGEAPLTAASGFHTISPELRPVVEPRGGLHTHHFQFRAEGATRRRYEALAGRLGVHFPQLPRARMLDAVYAGDWNRVRLRRGRLGDGPVAPRPLDEVAPPEHREILRWYDPGDDARVG